MFKLGEGKKNSIVESRAFPGIFGHALRKTTPKGSPKATQTLHLK